VGPRGTRKRDDSPLLSASFIGSSVVIAFPRVERIDHCLPACAYIPVADRERGRERERGGGGSGDSTPDSPHGTSKNAFFGFDQQNGGTSGPFRGGGGGDGDGAGTQKLRLLHSLLEERALGVHVVAARTFDIVKRTGTEGPHCLPCEFASLVANNNNPRDARGRKEKDTRARRGGRLESFRRSRPPFPLEKSEVLRFSAFPGRGELFVESRLLLVRSFRESD